MSELKDIVPPLELCKQIPAGAFDDSALVWMDDRCVLGELPPCVSVRVKNTYHKILAPAPTLAEIMEALRDKKRYPILFFDAYNSTEWFIEDMQSEDAFFATLNPATAALRLWFDVNGVEK